MMGKSRWNVLRLIYLMFLAFFVLSSLSNITLAQSSEEITSNQKVKKMTKISMTFSSGKQLLATMSDNAAARDFLSLLPLTLTLDDYNKTEKVSDLPKRLSTQGTPNGFDPDVGDITYYAPWGNLAIFYQDFGYASGLVHLGKIDAGVEILQHKGPLKVTIEAVK